MAGPKLSLKEKIGQLFMVGFRGESVPAETRELIRDHNVGFIILFARNITSVPQIIELSNDIHSLAKQSPFIFTDQEGGTVVQFGELAATVVSPMGLAATFDPANARAAGTLIGEDMDACGIDGVIAPAADVNLEADNPIIGIRSFSDLPEMVSTYAREFHGGLAASGLAGCAKHFPGHGSTRVDTHLAIPDVHDSANTFHQKSLPPFHDLIEAGVDCVMTSHIRFPALADEITTFSPQLIHDILREKWRFEGVVITDCLEMKAIKDNFSPEEIVKGTVAAGVDVLTVSHEAEFQRELMDVLEFLVRRGRIAESRIDRSLQRIFKLKQKHCLPDSDRHRKVRAVVPVLRGNLDRERDIARRSVTLLRNRNGIIPVDKKRTTLIVEWQKVKATQSLSDARDQSMLAEAAALFFDTVDLRILPLDGELGAEHTAGLDGYGTVIAAVYSRSPLLEKKQARGLKQILRRRSDTIVAALGNPYDIREYPDIATYLATFGFRRIQVEALFEILIGAIPARGRLPVEIPGIFPRGFSWSDRKGG